MTPHRTATWAASAISPGMEGVACLAPVRQRPWHEIYREAWPHLGCYACEWPCHILGQSSALRAHHCTKCAPACHFCGRRLAGVLPCCLRDIFAHVTMSHVRGCGWWFTQCDRGPGTAPILRIPIPSIVWGRESKVEPEVGLSHVKLKARLPAPHVP
eukprot:6914639-Prymnesium_polylepis.2